MRYIEKIISGGQTGVDRGALEAAQEMGYVIGGWCPPEREAEDGKIPDYFPLIETPRERSDMAPDIPRSLRTEWNVRDADAILILTPENEENLDPGTAWTKRYAKQIKKDYFICNPFESDSALNITEWLYKVKPGVLNIAGPGEQAFPGIKQATKRLVAEILKS